MPVQYYNKYVSIWRPMRCDQFALDLTALETYQKYLQKCVENIKKNNISYSKLRRPYSKLLRHPIPNLGAPIPNLGAPTLNLGAPTLNLGAPTQNFGASFPLYRVPL